MNIPISPDYVKVRLAYSSKMAALSELASAKQALQSNLRQKEQKNQHVQKETRFKRKQLKWLREVHLHREEQLRQKAIHQEQCQAILEQLHDSCHEVRETHRKKLEQSLMKSLQKKQRVYHETKEVSKNIKLAKSSLLLGAMPSAQGSEDGFIRSLENLALKQQLNPETASSARHSHGQINLHSAREKFARRKYRPLVSEMKRELSKASMAESAIEDELARMSQRYLEETIRLERKKIKLTKVDQSLKSLPYIESSSRSSSGNYYPINPES